MFNCFFPQIVHAVHAPCSEVRKDWGMFLQDPQEVYNVVTKGLPELIQFSDDDACLILFAIDTFLWRPNTWVSGWPTSVQIHYQDASLYCVPVCFSKDACFIEGLDMEFAQKGFPVISDIASCLGVGVLRPEALVDPRQCIDNAMHVANVASVVVATLLSVKLRYPQSLCFQLNSVEHSEYCNFLSSRKGKKQNSIGDLLMRICAIFSALSAWQRFKVRWESITWYHSFMEFAHWLAENLYSSYWFLLACLHGFVLWQCSQPLWNATQLLATWFNVSGHLCGFFPFTPQRYTRNHPNMTQHHLN